MLSSVNILLNWSVRLDIARDEEFAREGDWISINLISW
jgi:hypothetical protein